MKNTPQWQWTVTLGTAVALCGTLAAQTPATPDTQASASTTTSMTSATGCLQRAGASSSESPSASPSASSSAESFVLKNAKFSSASSSTTSSSSAPASEGAQPANPPSASTSSSSTRAAGSTKELRLMADSGVNLAEHVGHQVSVKGRFSASGGASSPSSSPSPGASSPSSAGEMSRGGTFTVTSVSMISATCPAGS